MVGNLARSMKNAESKERKALKRLIESVVAEEVAPAVKLINEGDDVIYKAFIQPFKDVVDTAVHGAKTIATKTGSDLLKVTKMTLMSHLPWVGPKELDNIEAQFDQRLGSYLDGLDQEYKDVLDRNIENLGTTDALAFSFFLRPDLFFAKQIATGTPVVALDMLDTLTLGHPKVRNLKNKFADVHRRKNPVGSSGGPMSGGGGGGMGGDAGYGGMGDGGDSFEEAIKPRQPNSVPLPQKPQPAPQQPAPQQQQQQQPAAQQQQQQQAPTGQQDPNEALKQELEALLKDPEIIQTMKDNPVVKDVAKLKAQSAIDRASSLMSAKTFEDIKKHAGTDAAALEQKVTADFPPETTPEEKQQLLDATVPEFKKMYGKIYKSYLTDLLNLDDMFPGDIKKAIAKIDQLG
jgi:hypothetical protein